MYIFFNRPLLKKMKNMGYSQIVLDCSAEKTLVLLKQAQQLGMTGTYHSYLLTSLVRVVHIEIITQSMGRLGKGRLWYILMRVLLLFSFQNFMI